MEPQMYSMAPPQLGRNETLYHMCLYGSILLFLLNMVYTVMLFDFLMIHQYDVIHEMAAVTLIVLISFGCFVALATLYTITLNEIAYHHLRSTCLSLIWVYLGAIVLEGLWVAIYSFSSENHAKLFWLLFWPSIGEGVVYFAVSYAFYYMHDVPVPYYVMVPTQNMQMQQVPQMPQVTSIPQMSYMVQTKQGMYPHLPFY